VVRPQLIGSLDLQPEDTMESLPPEIRQLIITSLTHPRDLGRLRRVNTWWRNCVNAFTEKVDFEALVPTKTTVTDMNTDVATIGTMSLVDKKKRDHHRLVPWSYLRGFEQVKFTGAIEVSDPADLAIIWQRHSCSGIFLVVPPEKRATWVPVDQIGGMRCCYYGGFLNRQLSPDQRIGYVRTGCADESKRMQQFDPSETVYAYYHVMTPRLYLIWTHDGIIVGHFDKSAPVDINHGRDEMVSRLQERNPETLIMDHRISIRRVPPSFDGTTPPVVDGWITSLNLPSVVPSQPSYPSRCRYKIDDCEIVKESLDIADPFQDLSNYLCDQINASSKKWEKLFTQLRNEDGVDPFPSVGSVDPTDTPIIPLIRYNPPLIHQIHGRVQRQTQVSHSSPIKTRLRQTHWTKHDLRGHSPIPKMSTPKHFRHR
jgi:hypothetical protein